MFYSKLILKEHQFLHFKPLIVKGAIVLHFKPFTLKELHFCILNLLF